MLHKVSTYIDSVRAHKLVIALNYVKRRLFSSILTNY